MNYERSWKKLWESKTRANCFLLTSKAFQWTLFGRLSHELKLRLWFDRNEKKSFAELWRRCKRQIRDPRLTDYENCSKNNEKYRNSLRTMGCAINLNRIMIYFTIFSWFFAIFLFYNFYGGKVTVSDFQFWTIRKPKLFTLKFRLFTNHNVTGIRIVKPVFSKIKYRSEFA